MEHLGTEYLEVSDLWQVLERPNSCLTTIPGTETLAVLKDCTKKEVQEREEEENGDNKEARGLKRKRGMYADEDLFGVQIKLTRTPGTESRITKEIAIKKIEGEEEEKKEEEEEEEEDDEEEEEEEEKEDCACARKELEILRKLDHPNVIKLYQTMGGHPLIEYAENGTLRGHLEKNANNWSWGECVRVMKELAGAVQHVIDRGCLFEGMRLKNVLLGQNNTIKLCDFEQAILYEEADSHRITNAMTAFLETLKAIVDMSMSKLPDDEIPERILVFLQYSEKKMMPENGDDSKVLPKEMLSSPSDVLVILQG